jgi:putative sigma-54 modulation protein
MSGRHVSITQAIRDYAREKVEKLEKYFEGITNVQVRLGVEGLQHNAEIIVAAAGGATIIATAGSADMYSAIDIVSEKIERQLKKHKAKLQRRRTRSAR